MMHTNIVNHGQFIEVLQHLNLLPIPYKYNITYMSIIYQTINTPNWNCPFVYLTLILPGRSTENQFSFTMTTCWIHWSDLPLQYQLGFWKVDQWANCWTNGRSDQCHTSMSKMLSYDAVNMAQYLAVTFSWPLWSGIDMPVKSSILTMLMSHAKPSNYTLVKHQQDKICHNWNHDMNLWLKILPSVEIQVGVLMNWKQQTTGFCQWLVC